MKKLLIFSLMAALLLSLAACGGPVNDPQTQNDPDPPVSATTPDPDPAPETTSDVQDGQDTEEAQDPAQDEAQNPEDVSGDPSAEAESSDDEPDSGDSDDEPDSKETQTGSEVSSLPPQEDPAPEAPATALTPDEQKAIAEGLIGRPVDELYEAIGEPLAADYSPSCLDLDTDDGELTYNGFVVYTEGAPDNETVYAVI